MRGIVLALLLAACQGGRAAGGPSKEAPMDACKGVRIRVGTVAGIGDYRVGLEGLAAGERGKWKARLVFVDPGAGEEAPPAFEGEVGAGETFQVGGRRFRVTEVKRVPSSSDLPGSDPSFACIDPL